MLGLHGSAPVVSWRYCLAVPPYYSEGPGATLLPAALCPNQVRGCCWPWLACGLSKGLWGGLVGSRQSAPDHSRAKSCWVHPLPPPEDSPKKGRQVAVSCETRPPSSPCRMAWEGPGHVAQSWRARGLPAGLSRQRA